MGLLRGFPGIDADARGILEVAGCVLVLVTFAAGEQDGVGQGRDRVFDDRRRDVPTGAKLQVGGLEAPPIAVGVEAVLLNLLDSDLTSGQVLVDCIDDLLSDQPDLANLS